MRPTGRIWGNPAQLKQRSNNMTIWGTSYFRSYAHAVHYYRHQYKRSFVDEMLAEGSIHIGAPPMKDGETCILIDEGTRWAIVDGKK
jgi:hypothetical protein